MRNMMQTHQDRTAGRDKGYLLSFVTQRNTENITDRLINEQNSETRLKNMQTPQNQKNKDKQLNSAGKVCETKTSSHNI